MSGPHSCDPSGDDLAARDIAAREIAAREIAAREIAVAAQDPFVHDDAAYVLGALSGPERMAFERHLLSCADCRARVTEVADVPRRLAALTVDDVIDDVVGAGVLAGDAPAGGSPGRGIDESMPDTLLPGLLRRAAAQRRRRRVLVPSLAGFAAACLIALALVAWPFSTSTTRPPRPISRALVPVLVSPVRAKAALVAKPWGTEIDLRCRYTKDFDDPLPYLLKVSDRHGREERLGTWTLPAGKEVSFKAGTALRPAQISQVVIAQLDGTAILRLAN